MIRAAVVGLGWWGQRIWSSLQGSERIEIVHGVDVTFDHLGEFAERSGLSLTDSYDEVLGDSSVDAVILTTPHGLHEEQVVAAAGAGKKIFCEKPLALNGASARRMMEACTARGILLGIGHERRYEPAMIEVKRMVDDGEIGTLRHLEVNWSYSLVAGAATAAWRQDPAQAPAGLMTAVGVHMTDYLQSIAGPVARLNATLRRHREDRPSDATLSVQFDFASGATGYMCNIGPTPYYQRITLFGDEGWVEHTETAHIQDPDPALVTWRGQDEEIWSRTFDPIDQVRANLEAWAAAVEDGADYKFTDAQKVHNVEILEAIVNSTESGRMEKVG